MGKHGFVNREEKLIYESAHWHISPKDYPLWRETFVTELGLKEHE